MEESSAMEGGGGVGGGELGGVLVSFCDGGLL